MNLPPFVYSLAFWKMVSYFAAGVLAVLVTSGKLPPEAALTPAAILAGILAFLNLLDIEPQLRLKALENELKALKLQLLQQGFVPNKKEKKLNK